MTQIFKRYQTKALPELKAELQFPNDFAVPRITKIVLNAGIGKALQQQPKALDELREIMRKIVGQQPVVTRAKKSIAGFKIREGQSVGLKVTLRGKRMYDFLDKLINVTLPRTRDFRGVSKAGFDGHGNYSLGLRESLVFPEMAQEDVNASMGLQVTISTTASRDEHAYLLLKKIGFPFSAEKMNN